MEPKIPSPNIGPELLPANYGQNSELSPALQPDSMFEHSPEQLERHINQPPATTVPAILPQPVPQVSPTPVISGTSDDSASDSALPIIANDDDLIEKEWVDRAKKIIIQTKDDPYRREQEVNKLQADYLQKRYGRELGASQ
jgi:hypothetical protein